MPNHTEQQHATEEFIKQVYSTLTDVSKYLTSVSAPPSTTTSPTTSPTTISYLNGTGYDIGDPFEIQTRVCYLLEEIEIKFPTAVYNKQNEESTTQQEDTSNIIIPSLRFNLTESQEILTAATESNQTYNNNTNTTKHKKTGSGDKVGMSLSSFLKSKLPKKSTSANNSYNNSYNSYNSNSYGSNSSSNKGSPSTSPNNSYNSSNNNQLNLTLNNASNNKKKRLEKHISQYYTLQPQRSPQREHERHAKFLGAISKLKKEKASTEEVSSTPATPTEMNQRNMNKLINFFGDVPTANSNPSSSSTTTTISASSSPSTSKRSSPSSSKSSSPSSSFLKPNSQRRNSLLRRSKSHNL